MSTSTATSVAHDTTALTHAWTVSCSVADPELPVVTIGDLGIVRAVDVDTDGCVHVVLTPTYSGCPATAVIRHDVVSALNDAGFDRVEVRTVLAPAWTTDWITEDGRRKLSEHGIVPPSGRSSMQSGASTGRRIDVALAMRCPRCGSLDTKLVSRFGSTACQAMYRCTSCLEPFDAIKPY
ncbi:MAG TPA: 1,2-phenylacetyl-CoA epoxidase subunit PaaD [Acidothermaceae bacterium]|jgi:ring-1,2-phenylacetyl-CoA epoxidase subunit PaaD